MQTRASKSSAPLGRSGSRNQTGGGGTGTDRETIPVGWLLSVVVCSRVGGRIVRAFAIIVPAFFETMTTATTTTTTTTATYDEDVDEMLSLRRPRAFYDQHERAFGSNVLPEGSQYSVMPGARRLRHVQVRNVTLALKCAKAVADGDDHWRFDMRREATGEQQPPQPPPQEQQQEQKKAKRSRKQRDVDGDMWAATNRTPRPVLGGPVGAPPVLTELARRRPGKRCFARATVPCGFGKTGILSVLAALHGGTVLIVTDQQPNAIQVLEDILTQTNLAKLVPVKIAATSDSEVTKLRASKKIGAAAHKYVLRSDEGRSGFDATPSEKRRRSIFGCGDTAGILIIKRNLLWNVTTASKQTVDLAQRVFLTFWDLVLIDECDSVATEKAREAFQTGHDFDWPTCDDPKQPFVFTRFQLCFDFALLASATMNKHDAAGDAWLKAAGPLLSECCAVDGEETGTVAFTKISVVRVDDDADLWYRRVFERNRSRSLNCFQQLSRFSPEKARIVELLVHAHLVRGDKIIVYTKNISHARSLAAVFPTVATLCTGADADSREMREAFKQAVRGIWITTSVAQRGFDCQSLSVVINACNDGESPSVVSQRMGRVQRVFQDKPIAYFYDIVSPSFGNEVDRIVDPERIPSAKRYAELTIHGYQDRITVRPVDVFLPDLMQETKEKLGSMADVHVRRPVCEPDADAEATLFCNPQSGVVAALSDPVVELAHVLLILDHKQEKYESGVGQQQQQQQPAPKCERGGAHKKSLAGSAGSAGVAQTTAAAAAPAAPNSDAAAAAKMASLFEEQARKERAHRAAEQRSRLLLSRARQNQAFFVAPPKRPKPAATAPAAPTAAAATTTTTAATALVQPTPAPTEGEEDTWFDKLHEDEVTILARQFETCLNRRPIRLDRSTYSALASEVVALASTKLAQQDEWRGKIKARYLALASPAPAAALAAPAAPAAPTPAAGAPRPGSSAAPPTGA